MSNKTVRKCLKCDGALQDEGKPLECAGFCGRGCHSRCANLTAEQQQILEATPNVFWQCETCLAQRQSQQQLTQQLEKCLRHHEKRLQLLEEGLAQREWGLKVKGEIDKMVK